MIKIKDSVSFMFNGQNFTNENWSMISQIFLLSLEFFILNFDHSSKVKNSVQDVSINLSTDYSHSSRSHLVMTFRCGSSIWTIVASETNVLEIYLWDSSAHYVASAKNTQHKWLKPELWILEMIQLMMFKWEYSSIYPGQSKIM